MPLGQSDGAVALAALEHIARYSDGEMTVNGTRVLYSLPEIFAREVLRALGREAPPLAAGLQRGGPVDVFGRNGYEL